MDNKQFYLAVKDHAVTGESFELFYDSELDMLETHPQPGKDGVVRYYKSKDYISHTDSKRNLFEKLYHRVRRMSLKRKLKIINNAISESKRLLDIGCGTGDFLSLAMEDAWDVTGIEPNDKARAVANMKTDNKVFDSPYINQLDDGSFDVITLWHVLEHLPDLDEQISKLSTLLKSDGRLIIAVPNFKCFDAGYYKSYWAAYDAPRHFWHFSQSAIEKLFLNEKMTIQETKPLKYDAYYVSLLSEKYKSGWMNFFNAFFVATRSNLKAARTGEYSSLIYIIIKA